MANAPGSKAGRYISLVRATTYDGGFDEMVAESSSIFAT